MGIFKYFVLRNSRLEPENGVSYKKNQASNVGDSRKKNNVLLVKIKTCKKYGFSGHFLAIL